MIRARVTGMDKVIRQFDRSIDGMEEALDDGCREAAEYLKESIEMKFGTYQPGWEQLKPDTIWKKAKMGAGRNASKPLVLTGDMMDSFEIQTSNRTRKHTAAVISNDPKLIHHMYGAPRAGVPKRDPVRSTTREERETCIEIIIDTVRKVFK